MSTGQGASLNGFLPFGSDNLWNKDISTSPVDPNSSAIINFIGPTVGMHADFGSGLYQGSIIGIPYSVVGGTQAPVNINFTAYGDESDPGPMPLPANAQIEGGPNPTGGDRHVLVLDNDNCFLYELFTAVPNGNGSWNADSAAVWDLLSDANASRPWTWTSADAAGLPIFPGLVRYDEVAAGQIPHAIRFTLPQSRAAVVLPATHWASNSTNANAPPMGMRLRLKASYDISGFSTNMQVILSAMKKYGLIMADNGSALSAVGFARCLPAMSGALPWTASKTRMSVRDSRAADDAKAAHQPCAKIGDDVAVEIRAAPARRSVLGVHHQVHAGRVDDHFRTRCSGNCDARRDGTVEEQAVAQLHDVGLVDGGDLLPALACCECRSGAAIRVEGILGDDFEALHHAGHDLVLECRRRGPPGGSRGRWRYRAPGRGSAS